MKLFSTSSLLIPIKLKITTIPVTPKIVFLLFKERLPNKIVILECKHKFHTNCILNWFNKELNCPLCRKKIDIL